MARGAPAEVVDEEALALGLDGARRRAHGVYFTPAPLVEAVLGQVAPLVPEGPLAVVDPSCGAGAFLSAAQRRFPHAALLGLELNEDFAARCAERVPSATVLRGDALRGGLEALLSRVPKGAFELWIGNPPYNGTSPVLKDPDAYARLRALLPAGFRLPRGTSLRDDYAFFLLLAARRLQTTRGALAFVTPSSLLDAFLYAPVRHALLEALSLREVLELGGEAFANTRVKTCVTVWTSKDAGGAEPPRYRVRRPESADAWRFSPPVVLPLQAPERLLRPAEEAYALDRAWHEAGEPITQLVPISLPGLKTRFDELLVDDDPERLLGRVSAFLACPAERLEDFARDHHLPRGTWPKLAALKADALRQDVTVDPAKVRPFFRFAGAKHRGRVPEEARACCYLDRRLIPRGDHRLRGAYDPHAGGAKLLFNVRELPLFGAVLDEEGCVHDHRHTRFAPLHVPERILVEGLDVTRREKDLGPLVPNLSPRGRAWAGHAGGPLAVFRAISDFINSREVQEIWAPALGTSRELPVPVKWLGGGGTG